MKVINLTVVRELPSGVRKQLGYEWQAAKEIPGVHWQTQAWHDYAATVPYVHQVPRLFRFLFLRNVFAWYLIIRLSRKCDYILVRHTAFDPFSFIFSWLVNNRITIHHTKEVEEMRLVRGGWKGRFASALESIAGKFVIRRNRGLLAVTNEILEYQKERSGVCFAGAVYPNGIDVELVPVLADKRQSGVFNMAFICTFFSGWHGLENLFESVLSFAGNNPGSELKVHLIGELSKEQVAIIGRSDVLSSVFVIHGLLSSRQYRAVMESCDIGVGSLALEKKGLYEASTLKVREMLAMGLPVVSGHDDSSLPVGFPFYRVYKGGDINIKETISLFGNSTFSREEVRDRSVQYISKANQMSKVVEYLEGLS